MIHNTEILEHLKKGNNLYLAAQANPGRVSPALRQETFENGQHPFAIVITCSDSRVIPEAVFSCGIGDLFVIRVAGNVIGPQQLGSIEYAAGHLKCRLILVLGHTNCGAVGAAVAGGAAETFVKLLTDDIREAVGDEKDDYRACWLNVENGVRRIRERLSLSPDTDVLGAVYHIDTGRVDWENAGPL